MNLAEKILQDIRYGVRILVKSPEVTLVVVLTLALGIGLNTAIFSLVNGIILRPLPYSNSQSLVSIWQQGAPKGAFVGLANQSHTMDVAAFTSGSGFNVVTQNGETVRLIGSETSDNLFAMLGVTASMGRVFTSGDGVPPGSHIVVVSYNAWQHQFGADPQLIGRWIKIDEIDRQVVGVMPSSFAFPTNSTAIWIPAEINPADPQSLWTTFGYEMIGRLRPGATMQMARADFRLLVPQIVKSFPWRMPENWGQSNQVIPLQEYVVGNIQNKLFILFGAVGLILLIACANVANILLSRSTVREKEIAVRSALGAERKRIIVQLLTESMMLAFLGGILGVALAFLSLRMLQDIFPAGTPRLEEVGIDGYVLSFSTAIAIVVGLIFGLVPAFHVSKPDLNQILASSPRGSGLSRKQSRFSAALVIGEISLATLLVTGAGLLVKTLWLISTLKPGFEYKQVVVAHLTPSVAFCKESGRCPAFYSSLLGRLGGMSQVRSVALADNVPFSGLVPLALAVEQNKSTPGAPSPQAWEFTVSPTYFETMSIPLLEGRTFAISDIRNGPGVVIVSKKLAQRLWPGQDAVGKHIKPSWLPQWRTVVGVVDDVNEYAMSPGAWASDTTGDIYFPSTQGIGGPPIPMILVVRTENPAALVADLPRIVSSVNSSVPVSENQSMDEVISESVSTSRSTMWIFGIFALCALTMGAIGIYGVISYSVLRRTREIGIRMAIGASKGTILKLMLQQGLALILAGLILGISSALLLARLLTSLLYGVRPTDPVTLFFVSAIVAAVALLAVFVPSLRATSVDPGVTLKYE